MQWVEQIVKDGRRLAPMYVDQHGNRRIGLLSELRKSLPDQVRQITLAEDLRLQSLQEVSAATYLEHFGLFDANPDGQQVFRFEHGKRLFMIPASVLLTGLVSRLSSIGDRMLYMGALDQIAHPQIDKETNLHVAFSRGALFWKEVDATPVQSRFIWLTCFPSARQFFASVSEHAIRGQLGLTLPKAACRVSLYGPNDGRVHFVTRFVVQSLTPLEHPFPFTRGLCPKSFEFDAAKAKSSSRALLAHLARTKPRTSRDTELIKGPRGWAMSEQEWATVLVRMREASMTCHLDAKATVDTVLEKYGSGRPWREMPNGSSCHSLHTHWKRNGKWSHFKAILAELRAPGRQP